MEILFAIIMMVTSFYIIPYIFITLNVWKVVVTVAPTIYFGKGILDEIKRGAI